MSKFALTQRQKAVRAEAEASLGVILQVSGSVKSLPRHKTLLREGRTSWVCPEDDPKSRWWCE
jgi:hypothetical protein